MAFPAVDEEHNEHQTADYGGERTGVVGERRQQEPVEFIVLPWSHGYSIDLADEIETWSFVDELVLVDTCLAGCYEFGGVGTRAFVVDQSVDHPRIEHNKLNGEVIGDVGRPRTRAIVVFFDV